MELPHTYPYPHETDHIEGVSETTRANYQATAQTLLANLRRPVVEVGGPTTGGFLAFNDTTVPAGIITSNVLETPDPHAPEAILKADVRGLPFPDKSIGAIVTRSLTMIPEKAAAHLEFDEIGNELSIARSYEDMYTMALIANEQDDEGRYTALELWSDEETMQHSLRLAVMREARRVLEPGGLYITSDPMGVELQLLERLGFTIQATTSEKVSYSFDAINEGEFILALTDTSTPEGAYIESLSGDRTT